MKQNLSLKLKWKGCHGILINQVKLEIQFIFAWLFVYLFACVLQMYNKNMTYFIQ